MNNPFRTLACVCSCALVCMMASGADERIRLRAQVNGRDAEMIFDTATEASCLFSGAATRLGVTWTNLPEVNRPPWLHPAFVGISDPYRLSLFGTTADMLFLIVEETDRGGLHDDGIVGWEAIQQNAWVLDANRLRVEPLRRAPEVSKAWHCFSLCTNTGVLAFELPLQHLGPAAVMIDTGSPYGVALCGNAWQEWRETHQRLPSTMLAILRPALGIVVKEEVWAKEFDLGNFRIGDVPVHEEPDVTDIAKGRQVLAVLGLAALKRFDIMVDGERGQIYLRHRTGKPPRYSHNRAGVVFVPQEGDGETLIARVADGSPAHEAGIRDGDILLELDGVKVVRSNANVLAKFNSPTTKHAEIRIGRGSEVRAVTVKLRDILLPPGRNTQSTPKR